MTSVISVCVTGSESYVDVPIEENESDASTTDQVPESNYDKIAYKPSSRLFGPKDAPPPDHYFYFETVESYYHRVKHM
jgi:hypothetical protein